MNAQSQDEQDPPGSSHGEPGGGGDDGAQVEGVLARIDYLLAGAFKLAETLDHENTDAQRELLEALVNARLSALRLQDPDGADPAPGDIGRSAN